MGFVKFIPINTKTLFLLCPIVFLFFGFFEGVVADTISVKVINYNLWFGLGRGYVKRQELEPKDYREQRRAKQKSELKAAKPDILFLQEVNPVGSYAREIAKELGMSYAYQNTNCGISIFGIGLPVNLDMGIAILARPPLRIKEIMGLKLSGGLGTCNPYFTFQLAEFRYALFVLIDHPDYGLFWLVSTHFHHGVGMTLRVQEKIDDWGSGGVITAGQKLELENHIKEADLRREKELKNLFAQLNQLKERYGDFPVILAGDFNFTVHSSIYKDIIEAHGFKDSMGDYSPNPYTWDPLRNQKNHEYTSQFEVDAPHFGKDEIRVFFNRNDVIRRRIDYIFVSPDIEVVSHSLFGDLPDKNGMIGSDHFGVSLQLKLHE